MNNILIFFQLLNSAMCECVEILSTLDQIEVDIEHIYHSNRSTLSVWDIRFFSDSLHPHHHRIIVTIPLIHECSSILYLIFFLFSRAEGKLARPKATTRFVVVVAAPLLWPEREVIFSRKKNYSSGRCIQHSERAQRHIERWSESALSQSTEKIKWVEVCLWPQRKLSRAQSDFSFMKSIKLSPFVVVWWGQRWPQNRSFKAANANQNNNSNSSASHIFIHRNREKDERGWWKFGEEKSLNENRDLRANRVCINVFWRAHKTMWN